MIFWLVNLWNCLRNDSSYIKNIESLFWNNLKVFHNPLSKSDPDTYVTSLFFYTQTKNAMQFSLKITIKEFYYNKGTLKTMRWYLWMNFIENWIPGCKGKKWAFFYLPLNCWIRFSSIIITELKIIEKIVLSA